MLLKLLSVQLSYDTCSCDKPQKPLPCAHVQIVMDWLGKLLGLPQQFLSRTAEGSLARGGGVIQGTASEAVLVCMLAARARAMEGRPTSDMAKLVAYTSDQVPSQLHQWILVLLICLQCPVWVSDNTKQYVQHVLLARCQKFWQSHQGVSLVAARQTPQLAQFASSWEPHQQRVCS